MTATLENTEADLIARALPPDPIFHIEVGNTVNIEDVGDVSNNPHRSQCDQSYEGQGHCVRARHPAHWNHISTRNGDLPGEVRWVWSGDPVDLPELPDQIDDAQEPPVKDIQPGAVMRFRNRKDILLVVGASEEDNENCDTFDVLDLTHQHFRRIKGDKLVNRKPTDPEPTAEQMAWLGRWTAKSKKSVVGIALREIQTGRWDRATMTTSLAKMQIVPPPPRMKGSVTVSLEFELPVGTTVAPSRQMVREMLGELLKKSNDRIAVTRVTGADGFSVRTS